MLDVVLRCHRRSKSTGTHSQRTLIHCLGLTAVAEWRGDATPVMHAIAAWSRVRSEPVQQAPLVHWAPGRSIPGRWMVGSLAKDLFGTSTVWFCHRVRQRYWMARASSERLDHIERRYESGFFQFERVQLYLSCSGWNLTCLERSRLFASTRTSK